MINILIADDHALIREGFKRLIDKEIGMKVVGEAEDGHQVLELATGTESDVIILDISMPGRNGLELIKDLKAIRPDLKILILTMHPEDRFAVRALRAGASGYLVKITAPKELIKAIHKVANGGRYVSETLAEKLAESLDRHLTRADHEALSDREFEVFRLIANGTSLPEIARLLTISHSTANTYRKRILTKLDLQSNAEIIHYAIRNNLLD